MPTATLFDLLTAFHPISESAKRAIEGELTTLSFPKNHLLVEAPRVAEHLYFLQRGFAMSFTFVRSQKITEAFWKPGQIVLSFASFFEQTPSLEYIQLMEDSELLCLSYASLHQISETNPEILELQQRIITKCYQHNRQRIRELLHQSATTRHEKLLMAYHGIEQVVPQENIASWLGITPQSLSRIKRKSNGR